MRPAGSWRWASLVPLPCSGTCRACSAAVPADGFEQPRGAEAAVAADQQLSQLKELCSRKYGDVVEATYASAFAVQVRDVQQLPRAKLILGTPVGSYLCVLQTNMFRSSDGRQAVSDMVPAPRYCSHSTTNQRQREWGNVVLRRRLLAKAGWPHAVMLPASE